MVIIFHMGWPTVPYLSSHDLDRASDEVHIIFLIGTMVAPG